MTKLLKVGDRIRLKVYTINGWKGVGTVSRDQLPNDETVWFTKDNDDKDSFYFGQESCAFRKEVAAIRSKT